MDSARASPSPCTRFLTSKIFRSGDSNTSSSRTFLKSYRAAFRWTRTPNPEHSGPGTTRWWWVRTGGWRRRSRPSRRRRPSPPPPSCWWAAAWSGWSGWCRRWKERIPVGTLEGRPERKGVAPGASGAGTGRGRRRGALRGSRCPLRRAVWRREDPAGGPRDLGRNRSGGWLDGRGLQELNGRAYLSNNINHFLSPFQH